MHILMMTQRVDAEDDILGFTVDWIRSLASHVDKLDILTGYEGTYDLPDNVTVKSYGKEQGHGKIQRVVSFERHCAEYVNSEVDGVFVHMIPEYVIASWPWIRTKNIPVILWYAHRSVDTKLRIAHELVDRVVTATAASFRLPSEKLEVLGHGIDTTAFTPGPPETERDLLLGVGRLDPVKNFETLIDAIEILDERGRDGNLRIIGETSVYEEYEEELHERVNTLGITDRVTFAGSVPHAEIITEYRRAGALLNASQTGSLDKTEIESMACQTPTISSNDSYRKMIQNSNLDESALTFTSGDSEHLADQIEALLEMDPQDYTALGEESRSLVQSQHNVDALMGKLVSIFKEENQS